MISPITSTYALTLTICFLFQVKVWFQNRRTKLKRTVSDDDEKPGERQSSTMTSNDADRSMSPESVLGSDYEIEDDDSHMDQNIDVV